MDELGAPGVGEAGLSDVGAVVGATEPGHLQRARELMGSATFLLPGVGAQGGRVEDLARRVRARPRRRSRDGLAQHRGRPSGGGERRARARRPAARGRSALRESSLGAGDGLVRANGLSASLVCVHARASSAVQARRKVGTEPG